VTEQIHYKPWFIQSEINAHISGDLFNLPAGPVVGALSGEVRKQTGGGSSDTPLGVANCAGLRFNCTQGTTNLQQNQFNDIPIKNQNVKEVAFEANAPLLKDAPFAQALNLNGAVRYTSYDFGGTAWTWKLGLDWHVNNDVTLRATRSRDIEAPSLYALFASLQSTQGAQDRLTGITATQPNTNEGNANLVSETGDTTTAGIVWRPSFVPRFSISVDAYHIKIGGALVNIQGFNASIQDACYASKGASYLCTLQTRPLGNYTNTTAANAVSHWFAQWNNASLLETYGIDVEANYAGTLYQHPYTFRVFTTFQPHYLLGQPGAPTFDEGNVAYPNVTPLQDIPAVRLTGSSTFGVTDKLFMGLTVRYRGGMKAGADPTMFYLPQFQTVKALLQTDLNATYRITPGNEIFANVRNLFDRMPPHAPGNSRNPGYPGTDDAVGRYVTIGIRLKR
jgi:outer membrane receptor protein involved in Fe transport